MHDLGRRDPRIVVEWNLKAFSFTCPKQHLGLGPQEFGLCGRIDPIIFCGLNFYIRAAWFLVY
jgi:hypothetical protein